MENRAGSAAAQRNIRKGGAPAPGGNAATGRRTKAGEGYGQEAVHDRQAVHQPVGAVCFLSVQAFYRLRPATGETGRIHLREQRRGNFLSRGAGPVYEAGRR